MKPIASGKYRHRITVERAEQTRSPIGEAVTAWVPYLSRIAAQVAPLRGREYFAAGQMQAATDHRVLIRYRAGIVREMRIVWHGPEGDVPLDIVSVINVDNANAELELMCVEGQRNAR